MGGHKHPVYIFNSCLQANTNARSMFNSPHKYEHQLLNSVKCFLVENKHDCHKSSMMIVLTIYLTNLSYRLIFVWHSAILRSLASIVTQHLYTTYWLMTDRAKYLHCGALHYGLSFFGAMLNFHQHKQYLVATCLALSVAKKLSDVAFDKDP